MAVRNRGSPTNLKHRHDKLPLLVPFSHLQRRSFFPGRLNGSAAECQSKTSDACRTKCEGDLERRRMRRLWEQIKLQAGVHGQGFCFVPIQHVPVPQRHDSVAEKFAE